MTTPIAGNGQEIRVDHIISVVADIEESIQDFEEIGFSVKRGTLHSNGLINAHIKFRNHSSFELMSLRGEPEDETASEYKALLEEKEGGVFIVLTGIKTDSLSSVLTVLGIEHNTIPGNLWNYITFPQSSSLAHFFIIEYLYVSNDSEDILNHKNGSEKVSKVYVEGDEQVLKFLSDIGLQFLRKMEETPWGPAVEYPTKTGSIIVVQREDQDKRSRILSVAFSKNDGTETFKFIY